MWIGRSRAASHFVTALLKSRKRDRHVSNPAGLFVQPLKQNWGSQSVFRFWYDLARELGYCQGTEIRDGQQWVNLGGAWEKWESAVERRYSVDYLRKVLGQNKNR